MNKKVLWVILGVLVVALVVVGVVLTTSKPQNDDNDDSLVKIETEEDLKTTIAKVYENVTAELPGLDTVTIDKNDEQPYEAAIIKVKAGADVEKMKQEILDNINMNMWICVSADKLYVTNYKDVIFFVMSTEDWAKPVFESFKSYVGEKNVGKVLEKSQDFEDVELPPEMTATPTNPVVDTPTSPVVDTPISPVIDTPISIQPMESPVVD